MKKLLITLLTTMSIMSMGADFNTSMEITFKHEGSTVFRSKYGEVSKYGITKEVLASYNKRHKTNHHVTALSKKVARAIYRERYWNSCKLSQIQSQYLANHMFDFGVNSGIYRATVEMQKMCNRLNQLYNVYNTEKLPLLKIDGVMGSQTIYNVNKMTEYFGEGVMVQEFKLTRLAFLRRLGNKWSSFSKVWKRRIDNI